MRASSALLVTIALLLAACSGAPERPSPPPSNEDKSSAAEPSEEPPASPAPSPCESGATRTCKVNLSKHGSITNCYVGVRLCVDGEWSECGDEDALVEKYFGS